MVVFVEEGPVMWHPQPRQRRRGAFYALSAFRCSRVSRLVAERVEP